MTLHSALEKQIEKKQQEVVELRRLLELAQVYLQALQDTLKSLENKEKIVKKTKLDTLTCGAFDGRDDIGKRREPEM